MDRHLNDPYVKLSKLRSYRSRAAFKLLELDSKYTLFHPQMKVVDIGAAPGGWSQILADKTNSQEG